MTLDRALLKASWRAWYANDLCVVGPAWLQLLWMFVFSCALGLVFYTLGLAFAMIGSGRWPSGDSLLRWLWTTQVSALTIGFTIHALFALFAALIGIERIRGFDATRRSLFFVGVPLLGAVIGWPLGSWFLGGGGDFGYDDPGTVLKLIVVTLVITMHFDAKARQIEADKRATEARLRLLQGQIEPHFMFNTLGTVLTLIDSDAPRARQMLETFIDYLRASLGKLRSGDSTLGDELAMTEAYLGLMQMRMGERLAYRIDVEDVALRQAVLPPLLLQPLVENAIHHGLECKVEGGSVAITARRDGRRIVISVVDNGLGASQQPARRVGPSGNGVALDNLRSRLQSRWGGDATLALELRPDAGASATLTLPLEMASA
jgi:hypothetical protein